MGIAKKIASGTPGTLSAASAGDFDGDGINSLNQWLLSLAAYNAGPARVARLRREAADNGYDPNLWFDNVEIIAARRIGRETVTYVANIFKYFVGYQIAAERLNLRAEQHGSVLTGCGPASAEASSTQ